jgi:inhibitor of KinA
MTRFKLTYKPYGERAILVEWPEVISGDILKDIVSFKESITKKNTKPLVELISAYNSLLIIYGSYIKNFESEIQYIEKIYHTSKTSMKTAAVLWKIPVCYDTYFGLDLELISKEKGLTKKEIIRLHSEMVYTVYFIGFLPGFLYLGGLNEKLHLPRKAHPRQQIEKGAVGIGGKQTGVYPNSSPGGWNIIGNSPISFFDANKEKPCFAKSGDRIFFYPITSLEHKNIKVLVEAGVFQLENEVING